MSLYSTVEMDRSAEAGKASEVDDIMIKHLGISISACPMENFFSDDLLLFTQMRWSET